MKPVESKAKYLAMAEKERKLAVWADRKRMQARAKHHREAVAYFLDMAEKADA